MVWPIKVLSLRLAALSAVDWVPTWFSESGQSREILGAR